MGKKTPTSVAASKLGKRKSLPPVDSQTSSEQDSLNSEVSSNATDFSALIGALQSKFVKKSKEQSIKFEAQMKIIVKRTVEELSGRVDQYENYLTTQLDDLKKQLDEISRQREVQVAEFSEKYEIARDTMQNLLKGIEKNDKDYAAKFSTFFKLMNDYREQNHQNKEKIQSLVEEKRVEVTKSVSKPPLSSRRKSSR